MCKLLSSIFHITLTAIKDIVENYIQVPAYKRYMLDIEENGKYSIRGQFVASDKR